MKGRVNRAESNNSQLVTSRRVGQVRSSIWKCKVHGNLMFYNGILMTSMSSVVWPMFQDLGCTAENFFHLIDRSSFLYTCTVHAGRFFKLRTNPKLAGLSQLYNHHWLSNHLSWKIKRLLREWNIKNCKSKEAVINDQEWANWEIVR